MAETTGVLNGTNLNRDEQLSAMPSHIINEGVRQNFANECEVTLNQVDTGMVFVEVTRTNVSPNEVFLVPVWIKSAVVVDTSGTGFVVVRIPQAKINDGSSNNVDGTDIAVIEEVGSLPTDPYVLLATLTAGSIADDRTWIRISDYVIPEVIHYDEDAEGSDSYVISVNGITELIDGMELSFKANTTNTGACTMNLNGLGAKAIKKKYNADTDDGDIPGGSITDLKYDADNDWYQMTSTPATITSLSKANQAEAEAGTDDDKYMTSLKVKQSIDKNKAISIVFGEAINGTGTPQTGFISPGTSSGDATIVQSQLTENNTDYDIYGVRFGSQTFTMSTFEDNITRIDLMLMKVGAPGGNFRLRVYAVDGSSKPTGAVLIDLTIAASTVPTTLAWMTFNGAVGLTPGTEYAIVVDVASGDSSNYIEWQTGNGNQYSDGVAWRSTDSGGTWGSDSDDFAFRVWSFEDQNAGEVYQSDKSEPFRGLVDGFVTSNTGAGVAGDFVLPGAALEGFSLNPGEKYYVHSTLGEITTSKGGLPVGKANDDGTKLIIETAGGFVIGEKQSNLANMTQDASFINSQYAVWNVGFKPSRIDLFVQMSALSGAASNTRSLMFNGFYDTEFVGTSMKMGSTSGAFTDIEDDMEVSTLSLVDGGSGITITGSQEISSNSGFSINLTAVGGGSSSFDITPIFYR